MSESDEEYQESESDALSDDEGNDGKKSYVITTSLLTQCLAFCGCVKSCTFNIIYRHTCILYGSEGVQSKCIATIPRTTLHVFQRKMSCPVYTCTLSLSLSLFVHLHISLLLSISLSLYLSLS